MPSQKRTIGDIGEKVALKYLKKNKYKILGKNYQKKYGEIDIIAQNKKDPERAITFIEVKTQNKNSNFGPAEENISYNKKEKLIKTAEIYLSEKEYSPKTTWQIDAIVIELDQKTKKADLTHFKNAIWK